jgi:hypothetical protein
VFQNDLILVSGFMIEDDFRDAIDITEDRVLHSFGFLDDSIYIAWAGGLYN